ncbi:MAG TPA: PAS domain-containing protein, partial [Bacteroidetes bacterium]|nr:PAS domain-containing protein [Bacteroidota bacterium]
NLIQVFEYFNKATDEFKLAYHKLEKRAAELDLELDRKNKDLLASLTEVKRLKNYQASILEEVSAGVICTNTEGKVTIFNRAAEQITGIQSSKAVGKNYLDIFGDTLSLEKSPYAVLNANKNIQNDEKEIRNQNNEVVPIKFSISLIKGDRGEILGAVELFEDLTEIRKLQKEIQHTRTMSALGEMAANVTHEIRNPLGAIGGFAALLERDLAPEDPRQRLVKKIIEGVGKLDKIIGNLLFVSREIQPQTRKVPIKWVINDVLEFLLSELQQTEVDIRIQTRFPRYKIEAQLDPQLFQQMLIHLLKNGIQAMPDGGTLSIHLQKTRHNTFRIIIIDSGVGMSGDISEKLFFPFVSTKPKGAGLGLAIVRKIVNLHRGSITLRSYPDKGTRVTLEFPIK